MKELTLGDRPREKLLAHGAHALGDNELVALVVASGTLNATIVEPRDIYREAAMGSAAAVVVFHNHPSGDPIPSPDDVDLTRRLQAAGVLLGIELIDHVILGDAKYYSFKQMNNL